MMHLVHSNQPPGIDPKDLVSHSRCLDCMNLWNFECQSFRSNLIIFPPKVVMSDRPPIHVSSDLILISMEPVSWVRWSAFYTYDSRLQIHKDTCQSDSRGVASAIQSKSHTHTRNRVIPCVLCLHIIKCKGIIFRFVSTHVYESKFSGHYIGPSFVVKVLHVCTLFE